VQNVWPAFWIIKQRNIEDSKKIEPKGVPSFWKSTMAAKFTDKVLIQQLTRQKPPALQTRFIWNGHDRVLSDFSVFSLPEDIFKFSNIYLLVKKLGRVSRVPFS